MVTCKHDRSRYCIFLVFVPLHSCGGLHSQYGTKHVDALISLRLQIRADIGLEIMWINSMLYVFITARRSYASAVLGVVILSVRLSVSLSHACFVTNPKNLPAIFLHHMKGQSF